jgi:hypothetical protein
VAANATSATSRATATSNGVTVQPLLLDGHRPPDVILDYREFDTFLDIYLYRNKDALIGDLVERVIAPAEHKIEACIAAKFIDQWQKWVHFRPIQPILPAGACPLRPESGDCEVAFMSPRTRV